MKNLGSYLIEFEEDGSMKTKEYPDNCAVGGDKHCPVIVITYNKYTFSANNGIWKAQTQIEDTFLRFKGRNQGIIASDFFLPFSQLNLFSLLEEKRKEVVDLIVTEAVELFEYEKSNEGYWDGFKLHKQVVNKVLPIAEALYPDYTLLFLFDNATSHFVFAQDALCTTQINKEIGRQQPWLCNGWFKKDGANIVQPMFFQKEDGTQCQKRIQQILEKKKPWSQKRLKLEYPKPKCFNFKVMANCKICIKNHRCDTCKVPKNHSSFNYSKIQKCDSYAH